MMSLQPYLPPATSAEAGAVYALLQVISDPKQAKAALDKMVEAKKEIDNATAKQQELTKISTEENRKAHAENEKLKHTADIIASKAAAELGEVKRAQADVERQRGQIEQMEKQVAEERAGLELREEKIEKQEQEIVERLRDVQRIERDTESREAKLKTREADLEMREKTLADDIAEHNKWLAGLKPPRAR